MRVLARIRSRSGSGAVAAAFACALLAPAGASALGELTQKTSTAGCISDALMAGCQDGKGLDGAVGNAISPDGKNLYVAAYKSAAVAIFDRDPATGELTQKAGTPGCISETGSSGACQDGRALTGATSVEVSPDGKNVYAASQDSSAVAIFDRDQTTGALQQKADTAGCISHDGTGGACQDGTALSVPNRIVISADGKQAYVAAYTSAAVAIFDRDPTTGALKQKAGTAGCVSETGTGGDCQNGAALLGTAIVRLSPDGKNLYAATVDSGAVAIFDRDPTTGELTQKAGPAGCVSETGTGGDCQNGVGLQGAFAVVVSPNGKSVYAGADGPSNSLTIFDRDSTTGELTQKGGAAGCISDTGSGGVCVDGITLKNVVGVDVSPLGDSVYAAAYADGAPTAGVALFDRDATTGELAQAPGAIGCASESGTGGACQDGRGLAGARTPLVSADGKYLYVTSYASSAVAIFDRNTRPGGPDLAVATTDDPAPAYVGRQLTYSLAVVNSGRDAAANVVVTDQLPVGVDFVSASPGCTESNRRITCAAGTVAAGPATVFKVVVRPTATNPALSNTATVTTSTSEPNLANNSSTTHTEVRLQADVSISVVDSADPVDLGQTLTYSLTVANAGPGQATGVVLTDELSGDVDFVSASSGCLEADAVVTCDFAPLGSGTSQVRQIVVRPTVPDPALFNTATIARIPEDFNAANNASTALTHVRGPLIAPPVRPSPATPPTSPGARKVINGTAGNDRLIGTPGNDVISCGAGDDVVDARGGDDVIRCGAGDDAIEAGAGKDRVSGGSGNDNIRGGAGEDSLFGNRGKDRLAGGRGNDRLAGGPGNDRLLGNAGEDRLLGNGGMDLLIGGAGLDLLIGGPGKDTQRQ